MSDRDAWLARWASSPTLDVAEALERIAEETEERVEGYGLVAWLRVVDRKAVPVVAGAHVEEVEEPRDARVASALAAFGPSALPGLGRAVKLGDAATILARMAAHVPFVGSALWQTQHYDAIAACVRAGGIARDQLVLPPGVHKHGGLEDKLARVLARLGAPYAEEMLLLVERTLGITHDRLVWELDSLYRGKLAPELMPVLAKLITASGARAKASWLACSLEARAAPLVDELLAAVQIEDREVRRAAATTLAAFDVPERALPILEPMLESGLSGVGDPDVFHAVLRAVAAVKPPPSHLAARLEEAFLDALGKRGPILRVPTLGQALGKIAPERAVALLDGVGDLDANRELVLALLDAEGLPDEVRLAWVIRLLDAGGAAIKHASMLTPRPELVAPLVRRLAVGDAVVNILAKHDRTQVLHEIAPLLASPDAAVRAHALRLLIALSYGDAIARFLVDPEPALVRRAARWLILHGGAQLLPELDREARCAD